MHTLLIDKYLKKIHSELTKVYEKGYFNEYGDYLITTEQLTEISTLINVMIDGLKPDEEIEEEAY